MTNTPFKYYKILGMSTLPDKVAALNYNPIQWAQFAASAANFGVVLNSAYDGNTQDAHLLIASKGKWSSELLATRLQQIVIALEDPDQFWSGLDGSDYNTSCILSSLVKGYSASWMRLPSQSEIKFTIHDGTEHSITAGEVRSTINWFLGEDSDKKIVTKQDFLNNVQSSEVPILKASVRINERDQSFVEAQAKKAVRNGKKQKGNSFDNEDQAMERLCQIADTMIGAIQLISPHLR